MRDQLDIIEAAGYTPERFIWIHTQAEPDFDLHREMARRGAWLELRCHGAAALDEEVALVQRALERGADEDWCCSARPRLVRPVAAGRRCTSRSRRWQRRCCLRWARPASARPRATRSPTQSLPPPSPRY
ncbi:MAG: hypothetical protein R3A10_23620 [Caldilineaceae bacterium]